MGLIEIIITTFLVYSASLVTYLLWHRLLWGDARHSVPLLKHLYYGQNSGAGKSTHARRYEEGCD